jgi:hypothetical protein
MAAWLVIPDAARELGTRKARRGIEVRMKR